MRKANAALMAAIVFLLFSGGSAYLSFARLDANESWVRHTRDVQSSLAQFSMATARAGRLRAEYVDSGDASVLEQQAEAIHQVRSALATIRQMTTDNPHEQANCEKLKDVTEQRISLMNSAIELKKSGKSTLEAQARISRDIVSAAETTDGLLQHMYDDEGQLLAERHARVEHSSRIIVTILVISFLLAVVLFVVHHRLVADQVAARDRAEAAQRTISAKLLTLQDEERRKFARELHDSVGQHLAALKMAISLLLHKWPEDPTLHDCIRMLDDSISETRTISHLLHPPLLDEAGLNSASRWFVEGFGARSGIDVHLDILEGSARLTQPVELVLFRVLQESLTNVHRHSGATRADVILRSEGDTVVLRVRDYGRGMPPQLSQSLRNDAAAGGVGLAGMKERIREIGGRLEISSSSSGTEVVARVPFDRAHQRIEVASAAAHGMKS